MSEEGESRKVRKTGSPKERSMKWEVRSQSERTPLEKNKIILNRKR